MAILERIDLAAARNGSEPVLTVAGPSRTMLALSAIQTTGGTQMRAALDPDTVSEYASLLDESPDRWPFPPVVVVYDGATYWLADGFHRVAAARQGARRLEIPADVRSGTQRDAVLHAAGANAAHGLRRTKADKKRAVETLLRDAEWVNWNNSEIARRCNVAESSVRLWRQQLELSSQIAKIENRVVVRGEQQYVQNTAPIGARTVPPLVVNGARLLPNWVQADAPEPEAGSVVASSATGSRQQGSPLGKCSVCSRPLYDPVQAAQGMGACCAAKQAAGAGDGNGAEVKPQAESATWSTVAGLDSRAFALHGQLNIFQAALDSLDAWAEQTGHFTATLEAELGLRRVIELTNQELQSLGVQ